MYKKIIIIFLLIGILINCKCIYADVVDNVSNSIGIDSFSSTLNNYILENTDYEIDFKKLFNDLIYQNSITGGNVIKSVLNSFYGEIKTTLKDITTLFLIIILYIIISNLELNKDSEIIIISRLIIFISLATIALANYLEIVSMFKHVINILTKVMQVVSTFLLGTLMATGKISSVGVIEPIIILVSNLICTLTEYIVIPLFTVAVALNIVSKISVNLKMDSLSKSFRKSSLYIFTTLIGIFLMVLSFESNIAKSFDGLAYKTTQNIVSDTVPVVGKFLSDSLDTVIGATSLVGKAGGIIGVISMILIVSVPIIKLIVVVIVYNLLVGIIEPINTEKSLSDFIKNFADIYKDMLGILIGIMILFVLSSGIIMNIIGGVI